MNLQERAAVTQKMNIQVIMIINHLSEKISVIYSIFKTSLKPDTFPPF